MVLTSINNEKVKLWQKLKTKKYRDQEKLFLIEDDHLVNIALEKNLVKEIITIDENREYSVPTYYVNDKIMKLISSQVSSAKVIAVCIMKEEKEIEGNIIILDNLQDPGNLGTIIRSAAAFSFDTIILGNTCVDLYNDKVIRASEGMIFNVNVIRGDLLEIIPRLKDYKVVTTNVISGKGIEDITYDKIALVIGNEGNGVSEEVRKLCNEEIHIKMNNNCESLNAGVCASILMYEVYHG